MSEMYVEDWENYFREASAKTDLLARKYPGVSQLILEEMEASDPAKGKSLEWMVRQLNSKIIRWPEDKPRLQKALESFWQIKKSPRILAQYSANPDLSTYTMQTLEDLDDKVRGVVDRPDSLQEAPTGTEKIYDDGIYAVLKALSTEAACTLARGTKWCTSDPGTAANYLKRDGLFIWFKNGQKFAQSSGGMFLDLRDEEMVIPADLGTIYFKLFKRIPEGLSERIPQEEAEILKSSPPEDILVYARDVIKGRWPEAEVAFSKSPELALQYASKVLRDRFHEGEEAILTDPKIIVKYVRAVFRSRWPEGERVLMEHPYNAAEYASEVIGARWPEAEKVIASDAKAATYYAIDILKKRWPEAEEVIRQEPKYGRMYAEKVMKGRNPEAEERILQDGWEMVEYAKNVIKGRWPEAEKVLLENRRYLNYGTYYAREVIDGRWPELEKKIVGNGYLAYLYAVQVLPGRWPEAEPAIWKEKGIADLYVEALKNKGIPDPREQTVVNQEFA